MYPSLMPVCGRLQCCIVTTTESEFAGLLPETWVHVRQESGSRQRVIGTDEKPSSARRTRRHTTYSADGREGDDRAQEVTGQEPAVGGQRPHQARQKTWAMRVQTHRWEIQLKTKWLTASGIMEHSINTTNVFRMDKISHKHLPILKLLVKFRVNKQTFYDCFMSNIVKHLQR